MPVFAKGLPLRTTAQRRDALTGLVAGAIVSSELVRTAMTGLPADLDVRVTDGPTVLAQGAGGTRDRSRRARRPHLARLARPRLRLPGRTDRHRLRGRAR